MQHLPGHQTGLLALLKSHPNPKVATAYATGMNFMKRDFFIAPRARQCPLAKASHVSDIKGSSLERRFSLFSFSEQYEGAQ